MKIDNLDINERDAFAIVISIWEDLGNIEVIDCEYCKKVFKYLDEWFD